MEKEKTDAALHSYMEAVIGRLKADGKYPAVHTYTATLNSLTACSEEKKRGMSIDKVFTVARLKEYLRTLRTFNRKLEKLAGILLPEGKLSSYTPRHTWATLAFHRGTNIGIISKALGHSSIKVTETYLKPFENEIVDAENEKLIAFILKGKEEELLIK